MNRFHLLAAVVVIGLSGCAASGPESPGEPASAEETVTRSESAARRTEPMTGDVPEAESVLEVAEIPRVTVSSDSAATVGAAARSERVCRREMRTGSHRAVRVCRSRAEIARLEEEGKDTFDRLHRSQTEYP